MAQEIYNEGRVVGLSAWELFKREALSNGVDPDKIPDEREWLASMVGSGASMILRIPSGTTKGVHDFDLPATSELSAAGVIVANPFLGDCDWDNTSNWAKKVISYSYLIENDAITGHCPPEDGSYVPYDDEYSDAYHDTVVAQFMKLTDGIVYTKYAKWIPTQADAPLTDIDPNFNESYTVVRLYIDADITSDLYVMFTGFANKRILQSVSGHAILEDDRSVGGSTDVTHNNWANGGMLGPEIIPWASKIVFSVPNAVFNSINSLTRTIPSDYSYTIPEGGLDINGITINENAIEGTIRPGSIIDFNTINLTDYYVKHDMESDILSENIIKGPFDLNEGLNILTAWYPGVTGSQLASEYPTPSPYDYFFPPAIYAVQATDDGSQSLVPLDTAAPGTVKCFEDSTQAYTYKVHMPHNYAIYHNADYDTYSFVNSSSDPVNWPGTAYMSYIPGYVPAAEITVGNVYAQFMPLTDSNGDPYDTSGTSGSITIGPSFDLTWGGMLSALSENKSLDILGTTLHNFGTELDSNSTIGITNPVNEVGAATITLTGDNPVSITTSTDGTNNLATFNSDTSIKVGTNFIEFGSGLRLYIDGSEPSSTGVPIGSIGIGW